MVGVVYASLPFAIVAAITGDVFIAVVALALRAFFMYGSTATWNAVTFSSFTPSERAGINAVAALAWAAGSSAGAVISGGIRGAVGSAGYTANVFTLVVFYAAAATLIYVLFRRYVPAADVGAVPLAAPDSRA